MRGPLPRIADRRNGPAEPSCGPSNRGRFGVALATFVTILRPGEGFPQPGGSGSISIYPWCRPLRDRPRAGAGRYQGQAFTGTFGRGNLQVEIRQRADCPPSARWRQQGAVHRGRICGATGHADLRLRPPRRRPGRAGAGAMRGVREIAMLRHTAQGDCRRVHRRDHIPARPGTLPGRDAGSRRQSPARP